MPRDEETSDASWAHLFLHLRARAEAQMSAREGKDDQPQADAQEEFRTFQILFIHGIFCHLLDQE